MNIDIAYTINIQGNGAMQFIDQISTSIYSLKKTKRSEDIINVNVLYFNIPSDLIIRLLRYQTDDFKLTFIKIPEADSNYMQSLSRYNPYAENRTYSGIVYSRLFLAQYLPSIDRLIYLDSDTFIRKSLDELYSENLDGKMFGMAMGSVIEYGYNAGVMLLDLKRIRESENLLNELKDFMNKYAKTFTYADQTIINKFFGAKDEIKELPKKYNFPPNMTYNDPDTFNATIWHFYNGNIKPTRFTDLYKTFIAWNFMLEESLKV